MRTAFTKYWPLILSLVVLWSAVAVILAISLKDNQGHVVYAIDDPYIHMAMAKNFSQYGVWGVTRYEFTSTSSSLLWTLMLSGIYYVAGVNETVPLILNIIIASFIVIAAFIILKQYKIPDFYIFLVLGGIIFITPLPALIFLGLEHTLHTLVTMLFAFFLAKVFYRQAAESFSRNDVFLWVLAPGLTLSRYEGLFLILVAAVLLLLRRRWIYSLLLAAWATLPLAVYGIISKAHGWFWLPNSVLLKSTQPDLTSLRNIFDFLILRHIVLYEAPHLLLLIIIALALYILQFNRPQSKGKTGSLLLIIFIAGSLLHVYIAQLGWFYRYEAYLVALGLLAAAPALFEYLPPNIHKIILDKTTAPKYAAIIIFVLLLFLPLGARGVIALNNLPLNLNNTYQLQYQTGLFLKQYYPGATIAIQDLGAVNFLADIKCLDLAGIGDIKTAKLIRTKKYHLAQMYDLINRHANLIIIYDGFFYRRDLGINPLPSQWKRAGEWQLNNSVVLGYGINVFYAVHPEEEERLIANLKHFAPRLPRSLIQKGKYLE